MRRLTFVLAAIAICAAPLLTAGQEQTQVKPVLPPGARDAAPATPPAPAGTGVIAGTLVAADSGRPVRRARVTLSGGDVRTSKSVTTDDRGGFSFSMLPTGEFTLAASKGGYLDVFYGQQKPGTGQAGTPINLLAAQRVERLSFTIPRGGVITGTVIDEFGDPAFGTPVRAMRYSWRTGERALLVAGSGMTDDRGVYRIPALTPGEYVVSVAPRDSADQVAMVERMRVEEMVVNAKVSGSPLMAEEAKALAARIATVNDVPEPSSGYAPVYYPGTTQFPAATAFTLGPSEERPGIDVQLQLVPLVTIAGSVMSSQPIAPATVQLVDRAQAPGQNTRSTRTGPDGSFSFTGVAPGQYMVIARAAVRESGPAPTEFAREVSPAAVMEAKLTLDFAKIGGASGSQLWAIQEVAVDGRSRPSVSLSLQTGMTVSGGVRFEGGTAPSPAQLARMSLTLAPAGPQVGDAAVPGYVTLDAEGRFTIRGVLPGIYRVVPSAGVPAGFTIKSAVFAGRDALDFPLEVKPGEDQAGGVVTFSTGASEVSGMLQDTTGAPAPGYTVLIFANDTRYWMPQARRIQSTRPATNGRFTLRNLPAGDYRIVAVTDVEPGQWYDPALLRQLAGASIPVTVGDGEKKTVDLRIK